MNRAEILWIRLYRYLYVHLALSNKQDSAIQRPNLSLLRSEINNKDEGESTMKTTSIFSKLIVATAALFLFAVPAVAQDDDEGPITQGDDAKYLRVSYVKYKPGQREMAMQIIAEHFVPAGEKAGTSPPMLAIHFQTGKWDAAFIWEMAGGMADLEWYRSPDNVKWFAALAELEGGAEQAEAIWQKYVGAVADSFVEVGHHHVPEAD